MSDSEQAVLIAESGERFVLSGPVLRIGRAEENDLRIDDPRASRLHAELRREGPHFLLTDLNSRNGTLLNGQPLEGPWRLMSGDRITVAGHTFAFFDPLATQHDPSIRPLIIDEDRRQAWVAGHLLDLTAKELALLIVLYEYRNGICPKQTVAERVWPEYEGAVSDNNIDSLVSRLRAKLLSDLVGIENARGLGYKLVVGKA